MKKFFGPLAIGIVLLVQNGHAQSFAESALNFSRTRPTGSARVLGMGGAQVSLGGDFSSAYSNPAGLGKYNRSEFSISPNYFELKTKGDYFSGDTFLSGDNSDYRSNLNLGGIGMAFSKEQNSSGFVQGTFAITLSRTNDFNSNFQYSGLNENTSLIDGFIEDATGRTPSQFDADGDLYNTTTELAYDNYLIGEESIIDPSYSSTEYFTDIQGKPFQSENVRTKGAQNQWNFSYGANFDDKFYVGAGVGVASLNYSVQKTYSEDFDDDPLRYFTLDENLQIKGSGVNLTLGMIARPEDFIQLGASATTPTYYTLTDTWSASMSSSWKNFEYTPGEFINNESASTDAVVSNYKLATPWKLNAGATFFFGKSGLVSADVEHLNFANANYTSATDGISFSEDNQKIRGLYRSTTNMRLGGEYRLKSLRFRAGVNYMPDPFEKKQNDVSRALTSGSLGFGYRADKFFLDLAYVRSWGNSSYRPYSLQANAPQPLFNYQQNSGNVVATLGFSF